MSAEAALRVNAARVSQELVQRLQTAMKRLERFPGDLSEFADAIDDAYLNAHISMDAIENLITRIEES